MIGWPEALRPPFGLRREGGGLLGRACLAGTVLRALAAAGCPHENRVHPPPLAAEDVPPPPRPAPAGFDAWVANGHHGLLAGLADGVRLDCVLAAVGHTRARLLAVARDSAAAQQWRAALAARGFA
ncbi:MAG: hypothetical protein KF830_11435, partial [Planctomycetes bacterium]|nr:hypothetical protein [Planctomycetota bacterium]